MKTIPLTQGFVALVDDADYDALACYGWHVSRQGHHYYAMRNIRTATGRSVELMHRVIMCAPPDKEVDHRRYRDREKIVDNRRENLRICTKGENQHNRGKYKRGAASIFKGVTFYYKKWVAAIRIDGQRTHLGSFTDEGHAALAYDLAAIKLFGEHALTNFPVPGSTNWLYGEQHG